MFSNRRRSEVLPCPCPLTNFSVNGFSGGVTTSGSLTYPKAFYDANRYDDNNLVEVTKLTSEQKQSSLLLFDSGTDPS